MSNGNGTAPAAVKRGGLTAKLREYLDDDKLVELCAKLYHRATLGDMRAIQTIFDRLEGPAASKPLELPAGLEVQVIVGIVLRSLESFPEARVAVSKALQKGVKQIEQSEEHAS